MIIIHLEITMMNKLSEIKSWYKSKTTHPPAENEACKNCGTVFSGHYCPECGQSEKEINRPFSIVFYDFLGNVFAFDTRFWKTFINLLYRPGFLTKEFFEGKRVKYAPPLRVFVFASFILFLLLQIYTNRSLNSAIYKSFADDNNLQVLKDSITNDVMAGYLNDADEQKTQDTILPEKINLNIDLSDFRDATSLYSALNIIALRLEERLKWEDDPAKRKKLIDYINLARSPQQAVSKILKYISWAFFFLLPVFALILKLFYIRQRQYYIRHLIFSIHLHSFIFIVFTIITFLHGWTSLKMDWISFILFITIMVYFVIALKRFYGQSLGKVLLKFFGISFIYNIIFLVVVSYVFLNAFSII